MPTLKYSVCRAVFVCVPVLLVFHLCVEEGRGERSDYVMEVIRTLPNRTISAISHAHRALGLHSSFVYHSSQLEESVNVDADNSTEDMAMDGTLERIVFTVKELDDSQTERLEKLREVCKKYNDVYRPEYSALYSSEYKTNPCTTTYFEANNVNYTVCNILKGGLNSWKAFFHDNHINFTYKADCPFCDKYSNQRIVQVRHPLERLLSAWRHIFADEGWRGLDVNSILYPEIRDQLAVKYKKVTWPVFVDYVLLKNTLKRNSNLTIIHEIDLGDNWVLNHWAPIWFTCGVCQPKHFPTYIIKMETAGRDQSGLLVRMGVPESFVFPKVKITGNAEINPFHTGKVVDEYYSQLTKQQVRDLYELYRLDHELFDYSPQKYIDLAKE